jgi:hypothetical protein
MAAKLVGVVGMAAKLVGVVGVAAKLGVSGESGGRHTERGGERAAYRAPGGMPGA